MMHLAGKSALTLGAAGGDGRTITEGAPRCGRYDHRPGGVYRASNAATSGPGQSAGLNLIEHDEVHINVVSTDLVAGGPWDGGKWIS